MLQIFMNSWFCLLLPKVLEKRSLSWMSRSILLRLW